MGLDLASRSGGGLGLGRWECVRYIRGRTVEVAEILCGPRPQHRTLRKFCFRHVHDTPKFYFFDYHPLHLLPAPFHPIISPSGTSKRKPRLSRTSFSIPN